MKSLFIIVKKFLFSLFKMKMQSKEQIIRYDIHIHFDEFPVLTKENIKLDKIVEFLSSLIKKSYKIMAKQDQINASLAELNDATNALAAKIQRLIDGQTPGDEVSQESLDQLQVVADQLKAMGADEANPIPTETTE